MQVLQEFISFNRSGVSLQPVGLVIHSTATPGATAQAERNYFNSGDRQASAHYVVDWTQAVQMIPEDEEAWHAGPTANARFLSIEICEPAGNAPALFQQAWGNAAQLARQICDRHGWKQDRLWSHARISKTFGETDHTDPIGYFAEYGKTFDEFIQVIFSSIPQPRENQPKEDDMPQPIAAADFAPKFSTFAKAGELIYIMMPGGTAPGKPQPPGGTVTIYRCHGNGYDIVASQPIGPGNMWTWQVPQDGYYDIDGEGDMIAVQQRAA